MKINLTVILCCLSITYLTAQVKDKPSLLYKISGNGIKEPSYLFGTFHLMCEEDFKITPAFDNALKNTKQLYEELKMDDASMLLKSMILLKSDTSLKDLLGEEKYKIIDEKCKEILGMGAAMYNNFKPMMITSALTLKMIDCEKTVSPETLILKQAKEYGATVFGLETMEVQIEALNSTPLKKQVDDVFNMLNNIDSTKQMMGKLIEVYKKRDPKLLYNFMKNAGASDDFEQNLLTKRNLNWIPIITKAMIDKPTFFAVGAGHLGGENGVLNLLEKQGYTLETVEY